MSNSNGKITTPISMTGDIRAVLGESAMDFIGLCQSANINMWSKVKPGTISKRSYSSLLALCKAAQSDVKTSVYWTAPTSGYNMLGMWNGYNHNAEPPFQSWQLGDLQGRLPQYGTDTEVSGTAAFYADSGAEVGVADMGLSGLYAGVAIANAGLTQVGLVTCSGTWGATVTDATGQMCASQSIEAALLSASEARLCFPVLSASKVRSTELATDISGTFYALPLSAKSITLYKVPATHKAYVTIESAKLEGSTITLKLTPHVDNIVGTGKVTTWDSGSGYLPYWIEVVGKKTYKDYSFAASSTGTWDSSGNWTGATVTLSLSAATNASGGNYITVTVYPAVTYISQGEAASVTC